MTKIAINGLGRIGKLVLRALMDDGVDAEIALIRLDRAGISASSGAACSSGSLEPSHVLMATGLSEREAREGLRFTFGRGNTVEEAREASGVVREAVEGILRAKGL